MSLNCAKVPDLSCRFGMMLRWGPKRVIFSCLHSSNHTHLSKDGSVNQNGFRELNHPWIFYPPNYKSSSLKSSQLLNSKVQATSQNLGYPNVDFFQQVSQMRIQSLLDNKTQRERNISTLNAWNEMLLVDKQQLALMTFCKVKTLRQWEKLLDPERRFDTHENKKKSFTKKATGKNILQNSINKNDNLHHIDADKSLVFKGNSDMKNLPSLSETMHTNKRGIYLFKETDKLPSPPPNKGPNKPPPNNKATPLQLSQVLLTLTEELPWFFYGGHKYDIYHKDVVFVNGLTSNTRTRGLWLYRTQMTLMRWAALVCYTQVNMNVMSITKSDKESTVKVRWQVQGFPRYKSFIKWLPKVYIPENKLSYIDGISTFEVGNQGKVNYHVIDKMMRSKDQQLSAKFTVNAAAVMAIVPGGNPASEFLPGIFAQSKSSVDKDVPTLIWDVPSLMD